MLRNLWLIPFIFPIVLAVVFGFEKIGLVGDVDLYREFVIAWVIVTVAVWVIRLVYEFGNYKLDCASGLLREPPQVGNGTTYSN